jgi:pyridoxine/pyridoxamine 5'-phosphate oxidase
VSSIRPAGAIIPSVEAPHQPPAEPLGPLRRPPDHGGFVLVLATIEFWQGHRDRFHHRLHYQREDEGWSHWLLQP